ncbi:glycine receptor subunit alphaZ1 [Clonorchis sinensis]|uniref:Glycine receptor subunit alphaZ1 n=1 Tax=Clonorchis sinensis TaxID=79923 RepID=H2KRF3_CLOSI|nr:glycine receptor subunit alphaZ1 [Clonorchis sinensis]
MQKMLSLVISLAALCSLFVSEKVVNQSNATDTTDDAVLLQGYRRHIIPKNKAAFQNGTRHPLLVDVNIFVYSFSSISVVAMDYTIDLLLRQRWLDERLLVIAPKEPVPKAISYIKEMLWLPDLFFRNAKSGFLHKITQPNYLIWVDTEGVVTFSQKISLKVSCPMNLWNFPLDTQSCKLNMGSYGYAQTDLDLCWWRKEKYIPVDNIYWNRSTEKAVVVRPGLEINEFALVASTAYYCDVQYSTTGKFSCLELEFKLQRRFAFYLIYAYVPSMLIVAISWVSFLLDPLAVPGRVSIGLLCILALITHSAAILTQLPRISYIKAMDLWVFTCLAFVVTSLLEFAAANTISRRSPGERNSEKQKPVLKKSAVTTEAALTKSDAKKGKGSERLEGQECQSLTEPVGQAVKDKESTGDLLCGGCLPSRSQLREIFRGERLDANFAIGYPIAFLLFNISYWSFYLSTR